MLKRRDRRNRKFGRALSHTRKRDNEHKTYQNLCLYLLWTGVKSPVVQDGFCSSKKQVPIPQQSPGAGSLPHGRVLRDRRLFCLHTLCQKLAVFRSQTVPEFTSLLHVVRNERSRFGFGHRVCSANSVGNRGSSASSAKPSSARDFKSEPTADSVGPASLPTSAAYPQENLVEKQGQKPRLRTSVMTSVLQPICASVSTNCWI